MRRLLAVARKELQQLRRDRLTLAMLVVLPIMQLLLFGFAIDTDVRHIPTLVYDQDRSARARAFAAGLHNTGYFRVDGNLRDESELGEALVRGRAKVALIIPIGFAADLQAGRPTAVELVIDGTDPQTTGSASRAASGYVARFAEEAAAPSTTSAAPALELVTQVWFNPAQRTPVFIVPGLVGVILTMTMVLLTAMGLAREKERGTLEQLLVSPLSRFELLGGKLAPYVLIGYLQMSLILAVGHAIFAVPFRGQVTTLYAAATLFIAASLSIGLVFSTIARTQQQAIQMSFFFILPNVLLSGFMFPYETMPRVVRWLAEGLPLTHFLRIIRAIVLKEGGFADLSGELMALALLLVSLFLLSLMRFRKRLA